MSNTHLVELSDKELFQTWAILAWFNQRPVSSTLVRKLSALADSPLRPQMDAKYEPIIHARIIDLGKWLENYLAEQAEKNKKGERIDS
jgi:hypothetical protein